MKKHSSPTVLSLIPSQISYNCALCAENMGPAMIVELLSYKILSQYFAANCHDLQNKSVRIGEMLDRKRLWEVLYFEMNNV